MGKFLREQNYQPMQQKNLVHAYCNSQTQFRYIQVSAHSISGFVQHAMIHILIEKSLAMIMQMNLFQLQLRTPLNPTLERGKPRIERR